MNETYHSRQHLLWECEIAHLAMDIKSFPRRLSILAIFILSAINHQVKDSFIVNGFIVWFVLWLILRPALIHKLKYTRIAEIIGLLQLPLRWLVFAVCSIYLWYTGLTSTVMWWWLLALFMFDLIITLTIERFEFLAIEQMKAFLQTQPPVIVNRFSATDDALNL